MSNKRNGMTSTCHVNISIDFEQHQVNRHSIDFVRRKLTGNRNEHSALPLHYIYTTITTINNLIYTKRDRMYKTNPPIITFNPNVSLVINIQSKVVNLV
jgi:hypothetical protein